MGTLYAKAAGGNWSAAGTWSNVNSAGSDSSGPPAATDDVVFDSGSIVAVVVDTTTCVAKTVTCQAAANIITFTATKILTVSGNVTFYAAMTLSGTGNLTVNATATLTSAAVTFPGSLTFTLNGTMTLADNWTVTGLVTNSTSTLTLNGNQITCNGGLTATGAMAGTANIVIGGTGGTWSGIGIVNNNLTFNCTTATVSGIVRYGTGTLTYTSGTITTTGSTFQLMSSCTLNTNGINWNAITTYVALTITLSSNLTCLGTLLFLPGSITFSGAYNISCATFITLPFTASYNYTFVAGQTLTVTASLQVSGDSGYILTIKSATASSPTNIIYQGTAANCKIFAMSFTDVDASTSAQDIDNWYGGTLTRCTNSTFTVTAANATVGATYTNNGQTFTVVATIAGGTTLKTSRTGLPTASGTLTKASGTGDATITFSSVSNIGIINRTSADLATAANAAKIISDTVIGGVTGTYHEALPAEVLDTVTFGALSAVPGTYHEATEAEVQSGVHFGAASALTGTYVGGGGHYFPPPRQMVQR